MVDGFEVSALALTAVIVTFIASLNAVTGYDDQFSKFNDRYDELLKIKPLPNGYISSYFQFRTVWNSTGSFSHYRLFPKSLGEILDKYLVQELHLSLTQGLWRHRLWGTPPDEAPPPGVEIWVWFKEEAFKVDNNIDETWFALCNALSGLFCTSLNFVDRTNTISPVLSFRPKGVVPNGKNVNSTLLRYAAIPREVVCTENLTPWKKLLPCSSQAGIGTLLNGRQLFDVRYHSLAVHVIPVCADQACMSKSLQLTQTLTLLSEVSRSSSNKPHWSFMKLFGTMLFGYCPVASTSTICIDLLYNTSNAPFNLSPAPMTLTNDAATYDVHNMTTGQMSSLNVAATYDRPLSYSLERPPLLHANRYIKGYGRRSGIIHCLIHYSGSVPLRIGYLENLPYFAHVYAHTFKVTSNKQPLVPDFLYIAERVDQNVPFLLEAVLTLRPNSVTEITLDFDRAFLKWNAYPPDANHGFYISAAVISVEPAPNQRKRLTSAVHSEVNGTIFIRLYTEAPLLVLPTPDFSMPYNVICLVCTVIAFAFGPLHNITTKRLTVAPAKTKKRFFLF